jgi:hypothetical protein
VQQQKNTKARRAAGTGAPNCHLLDPALSIPTMSSGDSIYGVLPTTTTTTPNRTPGTTHRLRAALSSPLQLSRVWLGRVCSLPVAHTWHARARTRQHTTTPLATAAVCTST